MAKQLIIDTNKIYPSNNYGDFKILKELEKDKNNNRYVKIKFISTGYECNVALSSAMKGAVKDPAYIPQTTFEHPKYGQYRILRKYNKNGDTKKVYCTVLFERTGNILEFLYHNAIKGEIKNPYDKIILNTACIGIPRTPYNDRMYNMWYGLVYRCLNANYAYYNETDVILCERWKCFEYFLSDVYIIPNGEHAFGEGWQLTTIAGQGVKIYSPDTCIWTYIHPIKYNQPIVPINNNMNQMCTIIGPIKKGY